MTRENKRMKHSTRRRRQRGNTVVEFALVSVFLIPLLLGTINIGMNLGRSIQVTQVSRDAGHMYVRWVDFSLPGNQDIIVRLSQGLGMTRTGGQGKVILSRVMFVGQEQCDGAGLSLSDCTNYNHAVITQQIVIGNPSIRESELGEPPSNLLDGKGEINASVYLTNVLTRARNFNNILALQPGEFAYVSEAVFIAPKLDFPGFFEGPQIYSRTIF